MSFYIETTLDEKKKKNDNIGSGRNKRTSKHDRDICAALAKTSFQKKKKKKQNKTLTNACLSICQVTREQSKAQPDHIIHVPIRIKKILSIVPSFYRYELQVLKKLSSKEANS